MIIPISSLPAPKASKAKEKRKPQNADNPIVLPFTISFDRRERAGGWTFTNMFGDSSDKYRPLIVPQQEIHMVTADYTIDGVPVFIERKSHDDVIGSISGGAVNFRKEHERMLKIVEGGGHCCVIIETSLDRVISELSDPTAARQVSPNAVLGTLASYPMRYKVPWHWCGTRDLAENLALRILRKAWELHEERKAFITNLF